MHDSTRPVRCAMLLSALLAAGCSGFKSEAAAPDHDIEVVAANIRKRPKTPLTLLPTGQSAFDQVNVPS